MALGTVWVSLFTCQADGGGGVRSVGRKRKRERVIMKGREVSSKRKDIEGRLGKEVKKG